ncbi:MAG TPA: chemotaxis protein CheA [Burkholderiaceae bacterium]|jgi:two-component system chemotaxis sensor kinase CheA
MSDLDRQMQAALVAFIAESRELLVAMEAALLEVEQGNERRETINAIFRAAHTIKGSAGLFGLDAIVAFTHAAENVLDAVRAGELGMDDSLVVLLLSCCDHLNGCMDELEQAPDDPPECVGASAQAPLLHQLRRYLPADANDWSAGALVEPVETLERMGDGEPADGNSLWHLSLRFGPNVLRDGMDPIAFIHYLGDIGRIAHIQTLPDALPDAMAMDPETCYLGFEIAFESKETKATIEAVFDFVREDSQIRILPPHSRISEFVELMQSQPPGNQRLGEILVACGSVTERELAAALSHQAHQQVAGPIGQVLVEHDAVQQAVVEAALARQRQMGEKQREAKQEARTIRVDADRLDQLVDLIGELTIAAAGAQLMARSSGAARNTELIESTALVASLVQEVRDSALQLRMVRIGTTLSRLQRVVHDAARELGKDIVLETAGEDTEIDKTVAEKIGDPLLHLVRNAIDHGIESEELRVAAGKPRRGCVRLDAQRDAGSIVIRVSDDGGGLSRERILAKAVERGLIAPDANPSDNEVSELIFEPGFSTAEQITNLSGRGVGMDVVKRNIAALRGSVSVESWPGQGTTVSVRLPLTLSIIDGFLVRVGDGVFVVPMDMIEECVDFTPADATQGEHEYVDLRGQVLPYMRLREVFGIGGPAPRRESIVVIRHGAQRAGLVVDTLLGEFQTVIKPLGPVFAHLRAISGSTLLGSGEVALILDVTALLARLGGAHHNIPRLTAAH